MELDDAYANAAYIPDADAFIPRWETRARTFREDQGARAELGIQYGGSARQAYDLFTPEGPPQGTVIFVHGGYWLKFDRSYWSHLAAGPLARGWAVAMPSYDLCPQVSIADISRQIATAVQNVAARTQGPLAVTGHSAGGHLAARMMDRSLTPETVAARMMAVVPISPLSDLRPFLKTSMNAELRLDLAAAEAESPVMMKNRHAVRVTVRVGAAERPVFLDQAQWLASAWGCEQVIVPGKHHFDVIDALEEADSDLVAALTKVV